MASHIPIHCIAALPNCTSLQHIATFFQHTIFSYSLTTATEFSFPFVLFVLEEHGWLARILTSESLGFFNQMLVKPTISCETAQILTLHRNVTRSALLRFLCCYSNCRLLIEFHHSNNLIILTLAKNFFYIDNPTSQVVCFNLLTKRPYLVKLCWILGIFTKKISASF